MQVRPVTKVVKGMKVSEGAGVTVCRTLGTPMLRNLDPFLMLDELRCPSDQAAAGFPGTTRRRKQISRSGDRGAWASELAPSVASPQTTPTVASRRAAS